MVTKENIPFIAVWLFLALAIGFGAFMGAALGGSDINFPPTGTAFVETTEASAKVQWQKLLRLRDTTTSGFQSAYREVTSRRVAFPTIDVPYRAWIVNVKKLPSIIMDFLSFLVVLIGRIFVTVLKVLIVGLPIYLTLCFLSASFGKQHSPATHREKAYVGHVVRFD